ncbi:phage holin family protein [Sphingobium sufflavum]|uniref:phage holin family protein n=1 Tax=Sphingobium sufflavum TaxID=1129547 RepID=UPI001F229D53|nr:phage holin family protein [Sphingobium sufflavum]MCE7797788.1 phage holin family protein [Sphingobium sufflavum]
MADDDLDRGDRSTMGEVEQERVRDDGPSLGETVQRLSHAARESVDAELSLVRLRAALLGTATKWIAVLAVIAVITAFAMIVTLMIGALLALSQLWGLGWALLAVTGVALLAILLCGLGIRAQVARVKGIVR